MDTLHGEVPFTETSGEHGEDNGDLADLEVGEFLSPREFFLLTPIFLVSWKAVLFVSSFKRNLFQVVHSNGQYCST